MSAVTLAFPGEPTPSKNLHLSKYIPTLFLQALLEYAENPDCMDFSPYEKALEKIWEEKTNKQKGKYTKRSFRDMFVSHFGGETSPLITPDSRFLNPETGGFESDGLRRQASLYAQEKLGILGGCPCKRPNPPDKLIVP